MTDEQSKIFSRNLSEFVSQSGKQQKEIAEELNVNQKTFNGWCNGLSIPKISIIRKLTDYFNTDIDSFIEPTKGKGILGKRIKEARKRKGFTQEELAKVLGIATGTVQQYELGKRQPRVEYLERIAEALDIKVRDLLNSDSSLDDPKETALDRIADALERIADALEDGIGGES